MSMELPGPIGELTGTPGIDAGEAGAIPTIRTQSDARAVPAARESPRRAVNRVRRFVDFMSFSFSSFSMTFVRFVCCVGGRFSIDALKVGPRLPRIKARTW